MTVSRACKECGATFSYEQSRPQAVRRLCDTCRAAHERAQREADKKLDVAERRKKRTDDREQALREVVRAADAAGMSYGKYVAMCQKQAREKKR